MNIYIHIYIWDMHLYVFYMHTYFSLWLNHDFSLWLKGCSHLHFQVPHISVGRSFPKSLDLAMDETKSHRFHRSHIFARAFLWWRDGVFFPREQWKITWLFKVFRGYTTQLYMWRLKPVEMDDFQDTTMRQEAKDLIVMMWLWWHSPVRWATLSENPGFKRFIP